MLIDREVPIKAYREAHALPAAFGVAWFEPKDDAGLGSLANAGAVLLDLRAGWLGALPERMPAAQWLARLPALVDDFRARLIAINAAVGLREVEIEFAAAGLRDAAEAIAFAHLRAGASRTEPPPFDTVYAEWLDIGTRVSSTVHTYAHHVERWGVQVVTNVYGRWGLRITRPVPPLYAIEREPGGEDVVDWVDDSALACPAAAYMESLLREVAVRMG